MTTHDTKMVRALCTAFVRRAELLGFAGIERDQRAADFILGASIALRELGKEQLSHDVAMFGALAVADQGYGLVERMARKTQTPAGR